MFYDGKENFGYFEHCEKDKPCEKIVFSISLTLIIIGFVMDIQNIILSLLAIILKKHLSSNDHFKFLVVVLIYNILTVIFLIVGWNDFRVIAKNSPFFKDYSKGWSYSFLIAGFSISIASFLPIILSIIFAIVKSKRITS